MLYLSNLLHFGPETKPAKTNFCLPLTFSTTYNAPPFLSSSQSIASFPAPNWVVQFLGICGDILLQLLFSKILNSAVIIGNDVDIPKNQSISDDTIKPDWYKLGYVIGLLFGKQPTWKYWFNSTDSVNLSNAISFNKLLWLKFGCLIYKI